MPFESFKHLFGHDEDAQKKKVVPEISTPQERMRADDERFRKIRDGVEHIMDEENIPAEDAMGREDFFIEKLSAAGDIAPADASFIGTVDAVRQAVREVAKERIDAREENIQKFGRAA
jgi:hypothetical protein